MRDRSQARCVLVQSQVATVLMIVADASSSHEPDDMTCAENHDVLKEFATAAAKDPVLCGASADQVLLRGCGQWYRCGRDRVARRLVKILEHLPSGSAFARLPSGVAREKSSRQGESAAVPNQQPVTSVRAQGALP